MNATEFDHDTTLNGFLTDYLDGEMDRDERTSFEEFLSINNPEKEFVRKAHKGKRALEVYREHCQANSELAMHCCPD